MNKQDELKALIKDESGKLICQTHPQACFMRDQNYPQLESLVLGLIFQEEEPVSVQTALAQLEQELSAS